PNRLGVAWIDPHRLHTTLLVHRPVEALRPRRAAVCCLEDTKSIASPGRPENQSAECTLVPVHLSGADIHGVRIGRDDCDRRNAKDRISGRHTLPVTPNSGSVGTPQSAAG